MIALLICLTSLAALAQVFVSYCRTLIAGASKVPPSSRALEAARAMSPNTSADDFDRFFQLVRLCPESDGDHRGIRAVALYCNLLYIFGALAHNVNSKVAAWILQERESCSHFAAVVLDRCISSSRSLFLEQASDRL